MKLFTLLALISLSSATLAAGPVAHAPKADPVRGGKVAAAVCASCHGADGNAGGVFPKLAGQHPAYLVKQLQEFKSGKRKNAIMAGQVANLTAEDMQHLAAFYATQTPKPSKATDKTLALAGQKLYRGGNAKSGVPACMACHGATGAGIPAQYPRLAGQNASYTEQQLNLFKNQKAPDARHNDASKMMQTIASKMTEEEIKAVAIFLQGLR